MTDKKSTTDQASGDIHKRIIAIMRELPAIGKDRRNTQQNYQFRGIDDVYNLVHPVMAKHGVFMTNEILTDAGGERQAKSGGVLITRTLKMRFSFVAEDGSSIQTEVIGEGMDSGDKAANKALSVGQKYAILQTFMIPTDDPKDPEVDNPEPAPVVRNQPPAAEERDFLDEPPAQSQFHLLDKFTAAKKQLGADLYYEVLGRYNYKHATDVPVEERAAMIEEMRMAYKAAKGGKA